MTYMMLDMDFGEHIPYSITYVDRSAEPLLPERIEARKGHKDASNRARAPETQRVQAARN
jgi:hypothetical protein